MLILKADRLGTTTRLPVCYPVIFQTDWYMDEGEAGEYVCLQVLLPRHAIHVQVAKVRWTERNQFGLEFVKMPESDKKELCEIVSNFYA
jgi:hypothetical protein